MGYGGIFKLVSKNLKERDGFDEFKDSYQNTSLKILSWHLRIAALSSFEMPQKDNKWANWISYYHIYGAHLLIQDCLISDPALLLNPHS